MWLCQCRDACWCCKCVKKPSNLNVTVILDLTGPGTKLGTNVAIKFTQCFMNVVTTFTQHCLNIVSTSMPMEGTNVETTFSQSCLNVVLMLSIRIHPRRPWVYPEIRRSFQCWASVGHGLTFQQFWPSTNSCEKSQFMVVLPTLALGYHYDIMKQLFSIKVYSDATDRFISDKKYI